MAHTLSIIYDNKFRLHYQDRLYLYKFLVIASNMDTDSLITMRNMGISVFRTLYYNSPYCSYQEYLTVAKIIIITDVLNEREYLY